MHVLRQYSRDCGFGRLLPRMSTNICHDHMTLAVVLITWGLTGMHNLMGYVYTWLYALMMGCSSRFRLQFLSVSFVPGLRWTA